MADDDLYGGYDDYDATLDVEGLEQDEGFQQALRTAHGNRPGLKSSYGTAVKGAPATGRIGTTALGRLRTGLRTAVVGEDGEARPTTAMAVRGAGYVSNKTAAAAATEFAPGAKKEESPEDVMKDLRDKVHSLMEESMALLGKGQKQEAIAKAQEAAVNERQLKKMRETHSEGEQPVSHDLTYSVLVNLATVYESCGMWTEAINAYNALVKNRLFEGAGKLRVNIGNIYFRQKKYLQAVKQYRMALDQIPASMQSRKNQIMRNIGHSFVKLGQYSDAVKAFELVLTQTPVKELDGAEVKTPSSDIEAAFSCIVCYYALGDRDKMRRAFQRLLACKTEGLGDEGRYLNLRNDPNLQHYLEAARDDLLRHREQADLKEAERCIITAARLIAPAVEKSLADGYDWCVEQVKASDFASLAAELEITKAMAFLKAKDIKRAVQVLKSFENKDSKMLSTAATNLSFLYFLEADYKQAERYADMAMEADKYNPFALINKGNCLLNKEEYDMARAHYEEALAIESTSPEALYNLGLVNRKMGNVDDALDHFLKLHSILPSSAEVVQQIALCYEDLEEVEQALEWYETLLSIHPTDPNALAHVGELFDQLDDKSGAFQYHFEAFRHYPSDIGIISWLGAYYIESQYVEKAIRFFKRAAEVKPGDVKWRLMIASCYRRSGNYTKALETYKDIHRRFPENIECLRFLVRICSDLGLPDAEDYAVELKRAEQAKERREARAASGRSLSGSRRSRSGRKLPSSARRGGADSLGSSLRGSEGASGLADSTRSIGSTGSFGEPEAEKPHRERKKPDASYADPVGALPDRPKTAARRADADDFDVDLDDDMLPE